MVLAQNFTGLQRIINATIHQIISRYKNSRDIVQFILWSHGYPIQKQHKDPIKKVKYKPIFLMNKDPKN